MNALEPDRLEVIGQRFRPAYVSAAQLEARFGERSRKLRPLQECASRREKNPHRSAADLLQGFDALTSHFRVRLGLTECFARRVERDAELTVERANVREPPLGR
jgi:hypothetical protein